MMKLNWLRDYFLKYRSKFKIMDLTLQNKIIISTLLLLIIPVIIIYYSIFNNYIHDKKNDERKFNRLVDTQAMANLDSYITDIEKLTLQPLYDANSIAHSLTYKYTDIVTILRESNYKKEETNEKKSGIPNSNGNTGVELDDRQTLTERFINRIMSVKNDINGVFITNMDGSFNDYKIKANSLYETGYNPTNEEWFKLCSKNKKGNVILKSTKYNNLAMPQGKYEYVFPVARSIVDLDTAEIDGVICIFSNVDLLRRACIKIKSYKEERIIIINGKGEIMYDTDEEYISSSVFDSSFNFKFISSKLSNDITETVKTENDTYHLNITKSNITDWKLLRISPEKVLYGNIRKIQLRLSLIMLILVILTLVLMVMIIRRTIKPLKRLTATMNVIESGDLSVRFKVKYNDDIGQLGNSFNKMINKVDTLINTVYVSELRKREAELNALQAQINPHFIYNTLESIRMMAELNDDESTSRMTLMLGKLLRYSISTKNQIVTTRQEIDHLKNYMTLQNYRFSGRFQLVLDISEELLGVNIIKLVFQPVVENAIFHGLETSDHKGIIKISGYYTDTGITFEIEDNGIGMTEEQVEQLNQSTNDFSRIEDGSRGIGLKNVNERIKLHYGEKYGIRISSEPGIGTIVKMELPDIKTMNSIII